MSLHTRLVAPPYPLFFPNSGNKTRELYVLTREDFTGSRVVLISDDITKLNSVRIMNSEVYNCRVTLGKFCWRMPEVLCKPWQMSPLLRGGRLEWLHHKPVRRGREGNSMVF